MSLRIFELNNEFNLYILKSINDMPLILDVR